MSAPPDEPRLPVLDYGSGGADDIVPIAVFPSEFEARLAASALDAAEIWNEVTSKLSPLSISPQGGTLYVWPSDVQRAVEVLRETPARRFLK